MPMLAFNPATFRSLLSPLVEPASKSFPACKRGGGRPPSYGALRSPRLAAMAADFFRQIADENFVLERVCRLRSRLGSGTASGLFLRPAAARSSASARAALRVTVSLQIFFAKYIEKISPEPSVNAELRLLGAWPTRFDGAPIQIGNSINGDTTCTRTK
jgi:hypothetical protein